MVDDLSITAYDETTSSQPDTAWPHDTMIEFQAEDIDKAMPTHSQSIFQIARSGHGERLRPSLRGRAPLAVAN